MPSSRRAPLFGPLPIHGVWTAVGLTRGQFVAILALSVALFVLVGGPVWTRLHDSHFTRLLVSYAAIPPAVWVALRRNGAARPATVFAASAVVALVKLVVTAGLLVVVALARA